MNKGLTGFVIAFCLLVIAAVYLGNADPITGAVAEARASDATGSVRLDILSEAFALIFHITTAGIIVTAASWLMINGGKLYRRWWSNKLTNRNWKPGPNAQYQQQAPRLPKISRDDLLWMYLANQGRVPNLRRPRASQGNSLDQQEVDHEINIDF